MPRKYKVTPIEASGRGRISYVAYFRTASGKRVCRGLGTDAGRAKTLCGNLETLWLAGVRDRAGVPSGLEPDAVDLYLDQAAEADPVATMHALPAADDRQTSEERLEAALSEGARWRRLYEEKSIRLEALERSALARLAEAGRRSPPIAEALARFAEHIRTRTTAGNAGTLIQAARRFCASLPAEARTLADVAPDQVAAFLDARAGAGNPAKKKSRRRAWYLAVSRLLNWAARTWGYPSQMEAVPKTPKSEVLAERGDIHWHELADVEAAIAGIPARLRARKSGDGSPAAAETAYWQALVGMLGYAGLQLAELAWLRAADVELAGGRGRIWVTTVEDPADVCVRHAVKSANRRRRVDLHPSRLLPLLKAYLAARPETHYLFPMPEGFRRRRRAKTGGLSERWRVDGLSRVLRGDPGGKSTSHGRAPKKPTPGLLPAGMNAKSLRRTFGSLLLRSGKSTAEVAAAMGNTEEMVRQHYARILGHEVDVDF